MAGAARQPRLFSDPIGSDGPVVINDRCVVRTADGFRVVIVSGVILAHYALDDRMAEIYAMVNLVEHGWAEQNEVARAFGCSTRSVRRYQDRFHTGGLGALGRTDGYPRGRKRLAHGRAQRVRRLKEQGVATREIARRLGVTPKAVRKLLKRLGWHDQEAVQMGLPITRPEGNPNLSAFPFASPSAVSAPTSPSGACGASAVDTEPLPRSFDRDPADRRRDRLLAYLGLLDDAAPLFRAGTRVPHAGVLCALPALVDSGIFTIAREVYGSLGPAFYGLRTTLVALLLMALLRIKRPEGLKEHAPDDLGRILGLDRAFEVKTLRRKLTRLAAVGRAAVLGRALAQRRVADRGAVVGFLYVDGHVRVYHGQHTLPKAHVARMRLAMPATTDYWVNDVTGQPLFVVTAEANAGMTTMLPRVLEEVRALVGPRRVTVVFDRGGYSPKLFVKLVAEGFDILTYRKGRSRRVPRSRFREHQAVIDGQKVSYQLADQHVRLLRGTLQLRQVTRLSADGHQTPILTSRRDLPTVEVAFPCSGGGAKRTSSGTPRRVRIGRLGRLHRHPGQPGARRPGSEARHAHRQASARARRLRPAHRRIWRASLPRPGARSAVDAGLQDRPQPSWPRAFETRSPVSPHSSRRVRHIQTDPRPRRRPVEHRQACPERKLLTNLVKMVAYQAESDLVHLVTSHYKRAADEGAHSYSPPCPTFRRSGRGYQVVNSAGRMPRSVTMRSCRASSCGWNV